MLRRSGSTGNLVVSEPGHNSNPHHHLTLLTLRLDTASCTTTNHHERHHHTNKDDLSDLSLDSGVNLYFSPSASPTSPPENNNTISKDDFVPKMVGKLAASNGSDAASSCEEDLSEVDDELTNSSEELDFSNLDDENLNNCFVSYQFDDYPDSVFLVSEDQLDLGRSRLRRSSVLNPDEVYVLKQFNKTEDICDKEGNNVKRSKSIKSRI